MKRATTTSYAGRQVDIELLHHVGEMLRKQRVRPDIAHDYEINRKTGDEDMVSRPRIVAGIEKAVQRYAKLFLTHIGSVKLSPDVGSTIVRSIRTGQVSNLAYLNHLYAMANVNALLALREDDADSATFGEIPDDERIVSTRLVDIEMDYSTSRIRIHIFITTAAGESFTFILPVSSGIQ